MTTDNITTNAPEIAPMHDDDALRIRTGLKIAQQPASGASVLAVYRGETWAVLRNSHGPIGAAVLDGGVWRDRSYSVPADLAETGVTS